MAYPRIAGLRSHRLRCTYTLASGANKYRVAAGILETRIHHHRRCRLWNHHQSLPVFWQASQEVEEQQANPQAHNLKDAPDQARANFSRIKADTIIGMGFSNLVAFCIILTTAVTLHLHGVTNIQTSAQAASALRPIAGEFAFWLFSAGIIGTGFTRYPGISRLCRLCDGWCI